MSLGSDEAGLFANRSMRLREEADDLEGMIYGHALLAHIAKSEEDFEKVNSISKKVRHHPGNREVRKDGGAGRFGTFTFFSGRIRTSASIVD